MKFGVGLERGRVTLASGAALYQEVRNGVTIPFGTGYDIRVGKSVAITPMFGWHGRHRRRDVRRCLDSQSVVEPVDLRRRRDHLWGGFEPRTAAYGRRENGS